MWRCMCLDRVFTIRVPLLAQRPFMVLDQLHHLLLPLLAPQLLIDSCGEASILSCHLMEYLCLRLCILPVEFMFILTCLCSGKCTWSCRIGWENMGKDWASGKKSEGTSGNNGSVGVKAGEGGKAASGSGNDVGTQSGESGSEGSSNVSDDNNQDFAKTKKEALTRCSWTPSAARNPVASVSNQSEYRNGLVECICCWFWVHAFAPKSERAST